jgi:hypothetical protein
MKWHIDECKTYRLELEGGRIRWERDDCYTPGSEGNRAVPVPGRKVYGGTLHVARLECSKHGRLTFWDPGADVTVPVFTERTPMDVKQALFREYATACAANVVAISQRIVREHSEPQAE